MSTPLFRRQKKIPEVRAMLRWMIDPPRSPYQINGLNEADCELLSLNQNPQFKKGKKNILAIKIDSVGDEISWGLYKDPQTMGWVAGLCSLSDLSAVGASPLGIVFSAQWGPRESLQFKKEVFRGLKKVLIKANVPLLGGDSGIAGETLLTSTSLGLSLKPVTRLGAKEGDYLIACGKFGDGPAMGFRYLLDLADAEFPEKNYRPLPLLEAGKILSQYVHCMMDTSDGMAASLFVLKEMNGVSFNLSFKSEQVFNRRSIEFCRRHKLHPMTLFFAEHGDYQLVAMISPAKLKKMLAENTENQEIQDIKILGTVVSKSSPIKFDNSKKNLDLSFVLKKDRSSKSKLKSVLLQTQKYCQQLFGPNRR